MACHIESSYHFIRNKEENKAETFKHCEVNVHITQDYTHYVLELILAIFVFWLQDYHNSSL